MDLNYLNKIQYDSVRVGNQTWMSEDLHVTTYRNGDPICQAIDDGHWVYLGECRIGAFYFYEINSTTRILYNGYAVNDPRELAPERWQIPTIEYWETLITHLGGIEVAGGILKDTSSKSWISPNIGATNSAGFSAVGAGCKELLDGGNYTKGIVTGYWTKTASQSVSRVDNNIFLLRHDSASIKRMDGYSECGQSVRCIRIDSTC
jgi:uncharacterized protein (TIGR02145 family)